MDERTTRVQMEGIDWPAVLPVVHLFQSFRMAIQPAKLVLSLLLVVVVVLGGRGLDLAWGPAVEPGAVQAYLQQAWPGYASSGAGAFYALPMEAPGGIFDTAMTLEVAAFERMIDAAMNLNFGVRALLAGEGHGQGAMGALIVMVAVVPSWLAVQHPLFATIFAIFLLLAVALIGGAVSRLAALEACRDQRGSVLEGLRFAGQRYPWLVLAPVLPLLVAGVFGLMLAIGGAALFNLPALDVIGSLLFGLFLIGGLVITLILLGWVVGVHLLYPSIGVEGTDAFDAISRAFNYILGRPWRYLLYTGAMLVYGAITYLFFGLIIFAALAITHGAVGLWVGGGSDVAGNLSRFDAMLPPPQFGQLLPPMQATADRTSGSASVAAWIVMVWARLLVALLPAFAVSYYYSAHTWIYLLLRRAADGTEFDDLYLAEPSQDRLTASPNAPTASNEPRDDASA
jgi:hypothetical protein